MHRADYLRAYVMHHHGGGYSDIKAHTISWASAFDRLDAAPPETWGLGYPERRARDAAQLPGPLGDDLRLHHRRLLGVCGFIFRPRSPFTAEWLAETEARLDAHLSQLERHPGNALGNNPGYPIRWTGILGDIFHPLCLKYGEHLVRDASVRPVTKAYR